MSAKLDKVVTCCDRLQPLKLYDLTLITWEIDEKYISIFIRLLPLNIAGCSFQAKDSERKRLSHHHIFVFSWYISFIYLSFSYF